MFEVGNKVETTIRKKTYALTVTQVFAPTAAVAADKPDLVCHFIAEGSAPRSSICMFGFQWRNGAVTWQ